MCILSPSYNTPTSTIMFEEVPGKITLTLEQWMGSSFVFWWFHVHCVALEMIHITQIWGELNSEEHHRSLFQASSRQWDVVYNPPSISVVDAKGNHILLKFSYLNFDTIILLFLIVYPCSFKWRYTDTHCYRNKNC